MTKFIIIRHGQSMANLKRRFAGHYNAPLTELGHRQARATAEYIRENYNIDRIYASDLDRAFSTGKALSDITGLEITPKKELREIYAGNWEGVLFDDIAEEYPELHGIWKNDIGSCRPPNGESTAELGERIIACFEKMAKESPCSAVAVATHATPIRALQTLITYGNIGAMKDVPWVSNASVTTVEYENGSFKLTEAGYDKHLIGISTNLPKNI